jgi:hypothetical protein
VACKTSARSANHYTICFGLRSSPTGSHATIAAKDWRMLSKAPRSRSRAESGLDGPLCAHSRVENDHRMVISPRPLP